MYCNFCDFHRVGRVGFTPTPDRIRIMGEKQMRKKKCKQWNCPNLHYNKNGYCNECNAKYRAKHKDKYNEDGTKKRSIYEENRPNARERGYTSKWDKFRKRFLLNHPTCAICGAPAQVVDHKTATAKQMLDAFGEFTYCDEDYQALCTRCNTIKGLTVDKESDREYFRMKDLLDRG